MLKLTKNGKKKFLVLKNSIYLKEEMFMERELTDKPKRYLSNSCI
jgi:hypothetical protein